MIKKSFFEYLKNQSYKRKLHVFEVDLTYSYKQREIILEVFKKIVKLVRKIGTVKNTQDFFVSGSTGKTEVFITQ